MLHILSLIFGAGVGFSLGLTGGGGSIFAVPLLVYGLAVSPREAVGISLASVGATSAVGFVHRWRAGQVDLRVGLLFAMLGMLGAPLGTWLNLWFPETWLMLLFAGLMVVVAVRLWSAPARAQAIVEVTLPAAYPSKPEAVGPTCRRDSKGELRMTSRCAAVLAVLGFGTGVLSGLFGVGGGFVIVPALVLFSGMEMRSAVGTSLLVIALVSAAGVAAYLLGGRELSLGLTTGFIAGGVLGLAVGTRVSRRLSGPRLQQVFAGFIIAVAAFVVIKNTLFHGGGS